MTRTFTAAQIATGHGRLITSMDDVYAVLNHMTGDNLFTHQLPGAIAACREAMEAQHAWLVGVDDLADALLERKGAKEAMAELEATLNQNHGTALALVPLANWEHRDPIEELCDMLGAENVFVAPIGDATA